MKINDEARCFDCNDSLGEPKCVEEKEEERFTLYVCPVCESEWYRPH